MRALLPSACLLACLFPSTAVSGPAQQAAAAPTAAGQPLPQAVVDRALANELRAARDANHPMRYLLRKTTPRLTATREILETRDGDVARLRSINDEPLGADADRRELERLMELETDPAKQRHRKQAEDADAARAVEVLRMLPAAFIYRYAGPGQGKDGPVARFVFFPNPKFDPPDIETQVLTAMSGEIWIDPAAGRVTRLEGYLDRDVDFGWGILGRLSKGGWIRIEQAEVQPGTWRIVRLQMQMRARVVFKTRIFDTIEEQSRFSPLPPNLDYRQAIEMLKSETAAGEPAQR
ncbi:MAG TPA: hypothetical protein VKU93_09730 [Terracidiphilus sp.]|nr:hypothetical protein [Terracidiphilus sp.]